MMKRIVTILALFTAVLTTASIPFLSRAAEIPFNQNLLISDRDFTDGNALTEASVQSFLTRRGGTLAQLTFTLSDGTKSAAKIIADAGLFYRISQKVLLVILQKEQSLLTLVNPSQDRLDWATGFGVCDSCSKNDPDIQQFRGFANQVTWSARQMREGYLDDLDTRGYTVSGWGPGITKTTAEGDIITPANKATAALYTYTPHVHGNLNFWNLWTSWFVRKYPDGSLLRNEQTRTIFLIQNGLKRPFLTKSAFITRVGDYRNVINVSSADLDVYESGAAIRYANFSITKLSTGETYLLVGDEKRFIASDEIFRSVGFNPEEVITVEPNDIKGYSEGTPITLASTYPTGALLMVKETGGISYVENGVRHPIWSREILRSQFRNRKTIRVTQDELNQFPRGDSVKFRDGELVTSPNSNGVFVISNGQRRGIPSKDVFNTLGYRWKNVIRTSDVALLETHPLGEPINLGI